MSINSKILSCCQHLGRGKDGGSQENPLSGGLLNLAAFSGRVQWSYSQVQLEWSRVQQARREG